MLPLVAILAGFAAAGTAWWVKRREEDAQADESPRWEAYLTEERGLPAAVLVDLHWHRQGPHSDLATASWVIIDMEHPGRHGVGTAEEADRIAHAEQRLLQRMAKQAGSVFVGRTRAGGTWRLLFMGPSRSNPAAVVSDVLGDAGIHGFRCLSTADPNWNAYYRCLAPDAERMRWIEDARTFHDLTARGEPVGVERAIVHRVQFQDSSASTRFARLAGLHGFDVSTVEREEQRVTVEIIRNDVVDLERVHAVVMELTHLARTCEGVYSGWECGKAAAA